MSICVYSCLKSVRVWLVVLVLSSLSVRADVKPNSLFSDGVVLQQGISVPIWGTAKDGEKITVKFQDQTVSTTAKDGRWMVKLKPLKAGGPFTLTISGDNEIAIRNILIGEVWLCSGQSNMAFALSRASNAQEAIAASADPQLRLYTVPHAATDEPSGDAPGAWKECSPQSASNFSAVAYFFGRDLRKALKVPVGLIHSSVGGTPAEAWTSHATLEADPELKQILDRHAEAVKSYDPEKATAQRKQAAAKYKQAVAKAKADGTEPPRAPTGPNDPSSSTSRPSCLYNGMIAPLEPFAIAGVIWYQGESNSGRAAEYQKLFPAMIGNWRKAFDTGEFPFLFVQIAPHERMSPEIREAQMLTAKNVPRAAMAVITDVGEEKDIHPTQKEPVGDRLALAARVLAYNEKIEYSGPVYDSMKIKGDEAVLSFKHTGGGLVAKGGELKGFTIAGEDGKFVSATAKIEQESVVVSSPSVSKPTAVRYGWASTPDVNLWNKADLPASPFRTDSKK